MLDKFKKLVKSSDFVYSDDVYDDFVKNYDKINSNLKLKKIKMVLSAEELSKNGFDKSGSFNVLLVGSVFYLFFLISILLHFIILVLCKKNSKNIFSAFEVKKKPQKNLNFFYSKIQYLREKYYSII